MISLEIIREFLNVSLVCSLIFVLCLGLVVYLKDRQSHLCQIFLAFCLATAYWLLGTFGMFTAKNDYVVIAWDRVVYAGVVFIPALMYHFSSTFAQKINQKFLFVFYGISVIFLFVSRTKYFIDGVFYYAWGAHSRAQILHHFFLIYFAIACITSYIILLQTHRDNVNILRNKQTKYLLLAFFILPGLSSWAYLPAYGIPIFPFPFYSVVVFLAVIAYAITRYRFLDIHVVLQKSLVYGVAIISSYGALITLFWFLYLHTQSFVVWMIAFGIVVLFQDRYKRRIKYILDSVFFLDELNLNKKLIEKAQRVSTTKEVCSFVDEIVSAIQEITNANIVSVLIAERHHHRLVSYFSRTPKFNLSFNDAIVYGILCWDHPIMMRDELRERLYDQNAKTIYKFMSKHNASVMVRLQDRGYILGIILIAPKQNGEAFTWEELRNLTRYQETINTQCIIVLNYQDTMLRIERIAEERVYTSASIDYSHFASRGHLSNDND